MGNLPRRGSIEMHIRQEIGISLGEQKTRERGNLRVVEAVMRHRGGGIVDSGVAQPSLQPFGFDLAADPSQFRTNIASDQISGSVLHGVTRSAKRFSVEACACRGIGRWLSGNGGGIAG